MRRLDQLLSSLGYCSRREARAWVADGRVTVAGRVADDFGAKASPAEVRVDGEPLDHPDGLLVLLHKPTGLVCSHDGREGPDIYSLLPGRWRQRHPVVTSIGRLDKDTSGLLLLTDLSPLVHRLTSPKHKVPKVYHATVDRDLAPDLAARFASGTLRLDGEDNPCAPAGLQLRGPRTAELTLTEGRYHQARRMFAATGATVLTLHRARFGPLELGDLPAGQWRELPLDFLAPEPDFHREEREGREDPSPSHGRLAIKRRQKGLEFGLFSPTRLEARWRCGRSPGIFLRLFVASLPPDRLSRSLRPSRLNQPAVGPRIKDFPSALIRAMQAPACMTFPSPAPRRRSSAASARRSRPR